MVISIQSWEIHEDIMLPLMKIWIFKWYSHVCIPFPTYIHYISIYVSVFPIILLKNEENLIILKRKVKWKSIHIYLIWDFTYLFDLWKQKIIGIGNYLMPRIISTSFICRWPLTSRNIWVCLCLYFLHD